MSARSKKLAAEIIQRDRLVTEIQPKWTIECYFCGTIHEFSKDEAGETKEEAAHEMAKLGWSVVISRKYQVSGAVRCPECKGAT